MAISLGSEGEQIEMGHTVAAEMNVFRDFRGVGFGLAIAVLLSSGQPPHAFGLAATSDPASPHRSLYRTTSLYGTLEVTERKGPIGWHRFREAATGSPPPTLESGRLLPERIVHVAA